MNKSTNFCGDGFLICYECFKPQCRNCTDLKNQARRLAEYENTGLEPNEILTGLELVKIQVALIKLKRYKQLEARGKLIELPCKAGDTVYRKTLYSGIRKYKIGMAKIETNKKSFEAASVYDGCLAFSFDTSAIGETIFLTQAEAERALEVLNNV